MIAAMLVLVGLVLFVAADTYEGRGN